MSGHRPLALRAAKCVRAQTSNGPHPSSLKCPLSATPQSQHQQNIISFYLNHFPFSMAESMKHPVVGLLTSLMSIVATSELEEEIGCFLERHLQYLGYTVERLPIAPGSTRHNVYAYLGSSRKTRVLLTAHMDTVPPHIPHSIDGDIIRGRGSSDDLGPLAAQILAAEELRKEFRLNSEGDLGLLFVVGEENGGHGMLAANHMGLAWESGIFAEPTESKLAKGHKGQVAFEVIAKGVAW